MDGRMTERIERVYITVNAKQRKFLISEDNGCVLPSETLQDTLRDRLGLKAARRSCEHGDCGCCTVSLNGEAEDAA